MDFVRLQALVGAVVSRAGTAGDAEAVKLAEAAHAFLFGQIATTIRKRKFKRGAEIWRLMEQGAHLIHLSKAQLFQDIWVLSELNQKRDGFFVEFGAASGVHLSNTWMLEKHFGWTGILAEPNPEFQESLKANRTCALSFDCVHRTTGEFLPFYCASVGEYSGLVSAHAEDVSGPEAKAQVIQVPTVSLEDLLRRHGAPKVIDYMSIDTEGSEYEILSAFDFDAWDVRTISVEHNGKAQREQVFNLLSRNGYVRRFVKASLFDAWYVRRP